LPDVTPDERRDAIKAGLDLPSDPHENENENENDEAQETSQADGNRSVDKSLELASLQEELAQQVRQRAPRVNASREPFCTLLAAVHVQLTTLRLAHTLDRDKGHWTPS
jgi:hypothetical protein